MLACSLKMSQTPPPSIYPINSNFSMSLASISTNSSSSTKIRKSTSVKSSPEYRALRQQLFHLQSTHSNLKLVHEREMILAASHKAQLQSKTQELQGQLDEIRKDQVYLLNSEQEIKTELNKVNQEKDHLEKTLKERLEQLVKKLQEEQENSFQLESELKLLKTSHLNSTKNQDYNEEFVLGLLREWKDRVISLTEQNHRLESKLDELKTTPNFSEIPSDSNEELRRKLLSTYVSLESAQTVLAQRKSEADRLAGRIGNSKILEEKYRDAIIRIKRLETEVANKSSAEMESAPMATPKCADSPANASASDLRFIQLTHEFGSLKESLALANLNYESLQTELETKLSELDSLKLELDETKRIVGRLQSTLKVKESSLTNLKEQLDSTVNLLTETLKKKK